MVGPARGDPAWLGIDWYQTILTDPDIWAAMQVTAHFVFWTVVIGVGKPFPVGCRPHDGGSAHTGGRRPQTSKGGNRAGGT